LVGALDTLRYLVKGGRSTGGRLGGRGGIKQMLAFEGGSARPIGRARTMAKACERLVEYTAREHPNGGGLRVAVMHTGAPEMAERLEAAARERLLPVETMITEFTSVMAAHTGPGFVGLAVSDE
jgi:fatty acid-binding protein DegV